MSNDIEPDPKPLSNESDIRASKETSSDCSTCPFRHATFCSAVLGSGKDSTRRRTSEGTIRARQHLHKQGDARGRVMVLRDGWAVRFVQTPEGRRQVLSILIPGGVAGGDILLHNEVRVPVQAITPVEYCAFDTDDLKAIADRDPNVVWAFLGICFSGHEASEARIIDLGRRSAEQRIARLVLNLHERLTARGLATDDTMPFPLRQQTIADALGLTQVHVSRVMTSMRALGVIRLASGSLTILDMQGLRDLA